ncbi:MAG: hypothetical protein FJ304_25220 [Planctomycetes bacterium]|nr:hypothetical protein [Planctomycetota bacterium]
MFRPALAAALALVTVAPAPAQDQNPVPLLKRVGALPGELVKAGRTDAEIADALFVITLGRLPKNTEKEQTVKFLSAAKDRAAAGRDLAWALVNTKEFFELHGLDKNPVEAQKIIAKFVEAWGKDDKKDKKDEKK